MATIKVRPGRARVNAKIWFSGGSTELGGAQMSEPVALHIQTCLIMGEVPPVKMILHCPACGVQHIDGPEECPDEGCDHYGTPHGHPDDWTNPPHRTHLCSECGHKWRPADVATEGVASIETKGQADSEDVKPMRACNDGFGGWVRPA